MPSRLDRATDVALGSPRLAVVPAAASLLSVSDVARALRAGGGGGVTFPFPTGLPTLWTYVSLPGGTGGTAVSGPFSVAVFVPLFLVGLVVTSALEAGLLGAIEGRLDGDRPAFTDGVRRFTLRIVGVNLIRFGVVLAALPLLVVPPLAVLAVIALSYLVYGLPFEVVVRDAGLGAALEATVARARTGGEYAAFGLAHLAAGALASLVLSGIVRGLGLAGVVLGSLAVAVPSIVVATYGLLLFREFDGPPGGHRSARSA